MDKDCEPRTSGGNQNIVNGNEQDCLDRVVQVSVRTEGKQDGELH